jgi:hypothetical protein
MQTVVQILLEVNKVGQDKEAKQRQEERPGSTKRLKQAS